MTTANPKPKQETVRKARAVGLSRESIVSNAIEYLRSHPDARFTVAKAGAASGASGMAIYNYFQDSSDLTDAIVAEVFKGVETEIPTDVGWEDQVRAWMTAIYQRLVETPQCVGMLSTPRGLPPAWMSVSAMLKRSLAAGGIKGPELSEALFWVSISVAGFVQTVMSAPLTMQIGATLNTIYRLPPEDAAELSSYALDVPAIFEQGLNIMVERTLASLETLKSGATFTSRNGAGLSTDPGRFARRTKG